MIRQTAMTTRAWVFLSALGLIWGGSFAANAIALTEIGFWTIVALRVAIAAVVLWVAVLVMHLPLPRSPRAWGVLFLLGLIGNALPFSLITWGQLVVPSGLAAILNAATAIFSVLVAAAFFRDELLTARKALGVALGFAGVVTTIGLSTLTTLDLTALAQLALIGASLCYAFAGSLGKVALRGIAPEVAATGMLTGSALIMVPLALWRDGLPSPEHSVQVWMALAYSAVVATAVAYLLFYRLLALAGAGNGGLVTLLVAPVAIVIGAVFLDETLAPRVFAGFAILVLGLLVLDGRLLRRAAPLAQLPHSG